MRTTFCRVNCTGRLISKCSPSWHRLRLRLYKICSDVIEQNTRPNRHFGGIPNV